MKYKTILSTALGALFIFLSGFITPETSQLTVEVSNFKPNQATKIWVSVFVENGFLEKSVQTKSVVAKGDKVSIKFDLPPGIYAISTYHEENKNDKLDRYFIGKPKEPYGFSNNIKPFGPPDFEDCQFTISTSPKTISIKLIN